MPTPSPEQFWKLLAASRLVADDVLASLSRDFSRESPAGGKGGGDADTTALAKWLVQRGVITKWQGRRLLSGDSGPFFLGDYRLLDRLEAEGAGRLFRGRHEPSGRRVCVMLLDRKLCQRVDVWTEVVRRTGIAINATAPILSRTWALEEKQGSRFLVCEDVEGGSLTDELGRTGPLEPAKALALMLPVVSAVAELHRRGSVHGSLSLDALRREPAADGSGRVRLLQIPLAGDPHAVPAQPPLDATERIAGLGRRASFIAPELMLPGRFADERSDVYALGCMLHALLTGVLPCWQGDAQRTLSQAAFVGPPRLGPPQVPDEVAALVAYMVQRDPKDRYQDAAEAADQVAACLKLPPVSPGLPPPSRPAARPAATTRESERPAPAAAATGVGPAGIAVAASRPQAAPSRKPRLQLLGLGVAGGVALAAALLAWSWGSGQRPGGVEKPDDASGIVEDVAGTTRNAEEPKPEADDTAGNDARGGAAVAPAEDVKPVVRRKEAAEVQIVDSDELPWASPTSGRPPTLPYLAPGAQLVLLARPADVADDEEGRLFLRSLGPKVAAAIDTLESFCGCELDGIEQIQAGWRAGDDGAEAVAGWTIRFREPSPLADDEEARERAWRETDEKKVGRETVFVGKAMSFWMPRAEQGSVLVLGPAAVVEEMARASESTGGGGKGGKAGDKAGDKALARQEPAADLPPDLEKLVEMLDGDRHLTLFGSPHYLTNDGRSLLTGPLAALVEPLETFFGDGVRAAALSLHFGDNLYMELDAIAPRAEPAKALAARLQRQLETLGDTIEDAVNAIELHPYGLKLVRRLPAMFGVVAVSLRSAGEGAAAVVNAYLPRHAGHNLVLASELALEQATSGAGSRATTVAAAKPGGGTAAPAATNPLDKKMSLVFAKDTLEKAVQMVSEEVGMPMEILGGDLQLDGITKNQSFGLDERDKPAGEVLRAILAKSDPRLVYVLRSRDGVESLEVTTRAAVEKRGDKLPAIFAAGAADPKKPAEEQK